MLPSTPQLLVPGQSRKLVSSAPEAETTTLLAAMTASPDATRQSAINALIKALKDAGLWSTTDVLYVFAALSSHDALLNWKAPASFTATLPTAPTFTADRGFKGDGSTSYISTNWNPSANGVGFTQNSAHLGLWQQDNTTDSIATLGFSTGATGLNLYPRFTDGSTYMRINDNPEAGGFAVASAVGHYIGNRSSSTARQGYKNGSSVGSYGSVASQAPINSALLVGRNDTFFNAGRWAAVHAGGSLNATDATNYYNALSAYMTAVGA